MAQEPEAEVAAEADAAQEGPLGPDPAPDEVIEFFTLFSASERIGEALAPVFSEIMEPGAVREGREESGIDILAELAAREGAAEAFLMRDTDRTANLETCMVYERAGDGAFRVRSYLPTGETLPGLDADGTPLVPMPASDLDVFLQETPEPAPEE
ncbi:hypothetical protein [Erythrobacter sp. HL-111]|uniref:hypothetical protein n=1 Tax=Erythrobacter sp. HL-111 TaxID=1798193 RepID=UPI0012F78B8B|nr:hypothetical protein [Erythrobacter sp. HL-111]